MSRRVTFDTVKTTLGVASSNGSAADLNDLESDLSDIFVKEVLRGIMDIDSIDECGRTALFYSDFDQTEKLLEKGINLFLKDLKGKSADDYTKCKNSMYLISEFRQKFEESEDRDLSIPLTSQLKIFYKKYNEPRISEKLPDLILDISVKDPSTRLSFKYGETRFHLRRHYHSNIDFLCKWSMYSISEILGTKVHEIMFAGMPTFESLADFRNIMDRAYYYKARMLYNAFYEFMISINDFITNPTPDFTFRSTVAPVCDIEVTITARLNLQT